MRMIVILLAGCTHSATPRATLYAGGLSVQPQTHISPKAGRIVLRTEWQETCTERGTWALVDRGMDSSYPCNEVRHHVRVQCKPCRIVGPNEREADDEFEFGPTISPQQFTIVPRSNALDVTVTFTAGRDKRVMKPPIHLEQPTSLVATCTTGAACTFDAASRHGAICVRGNSNIVLGHVEIAGKLAALGCRAIAGIVPVTQDGHLVPGDYPVAIVADELSTELMVHVR